jgi:hypothetical protein
MVRFFSHKEVFLCAGIAIRRGFDPTGAGDTFGGFAGFITQSENVSFENMKTPLSMVQI